MIIMISVNNNNGFNYDKCIVNCKKKTAYVCDITIHVISLLCNVAHIHVSMGPHSCQELWNGQ